MVEIEARTVNITTGTFLRQGCPRVGTRSVCGWSALARFRGGVEPPSVGLAQTLARFQFPLGHLKTGTPARLDRRTIDWDACVIQPSENPVMPFGHLLQSAGWQSPNVEAGTLIDCYKSATKEGTLFDIMMIFVIGIIIHDVVAISSSPTTFMIIIHEVAVPPMMVVVIIAVTIIIIPHGMMIYYVNIMLL
eukprot:scaffold119284_cov66-Attheya_sp.AAC.1